MANLNFKTSLTGGGLTAVDRNVTGMKVDGSYCWASISNVLYCYRFSGSSLATADGLMVIIPYDQSSGTAGRWLLQRTKYLQEAQSTTDLEITADGKGIVFSDGTKITRQAGGGLRIIPKSDAYPVIVRNAANDADVLVLKPLSDAEAIAGEITNQPPSAASMAAAINDACDARHLYAQYQHTAASGTDGGTATSGDWRTLPITAETVDEIGCSLLSDVITLPKGRYEVEFSHTFFYTWESIVRLVTTPTGGTAAYRYSVVDGSYGGSTCLVEGKAVVDFVGTNGGTLAWQYRTAVSRLSSGLGVGASFGVTNIFGTIEVRKIG